MSSWRHVVPDFPNFTVRPNPERHAHNPQERLAEKRFHPPRAKCLDYVEVRVSQQRKIQLVLCFKFCLRVDGIAAAPEDSGVQLLEFFDGVTKLGRFVRSTWCVRLRIEIQNKVLAAEIRKRNLFAVVRDALKIRSFIAFFQHFFGCVLNGHTHITPEVALIFHSRAVDLPGRVFLA
jgi:hypothetical protein